MKYCMSEVYNKTESTRSQIRDFTTLLGQESTLTMRNQRIPTLGKAASPRMDEHSLQRLMGALVKKVESFRTGLLDEVEISFEQGSVMMSPLVISPDDNRVITTETPFELHSERQELKILEEFHPIPLSQPMTTKIDVIEDYIHSTDSYELDGKLRRDSTGKILQPPNEIASFPELTNPRMLECLQRNCGTINERFGMETYGRCKIYKLEDGEIYQGALIPEETGASSSRGPVSVYMKTGIGKVYCESKEYFFIGKFDRNTANGPGILINKKGDYYEGNFVNGKYHGQGKFISLNGYSYVGEFSQDFPHGKGMERWSDGSSYAGEYKWGNKHGTGEFQWANGEIFRGQFVLNKMSGDGVYEWPDGRKYTGEWRDNHIVPGKGVFDGANKSLVSESSHRSASDKQRRANALNWNQPIKEKIFGGAPGSTKTGHQRNKSLYDLLGKKIPLCATEPSCDKDDSKENKGDTSNIRQIPRATAVPIKRDILSKKASLPGFYSRMQLNKS
eukprot:TRINITY_DN13466_c0_g1_i2.p1 TRINITY_DN13466_c0_g1~~TRINITY_DN13466_c0_g1_i2.p1  ORF type:complete len:504 (-),score=110.80 TRINITY_DN13466_c0_g1_i2:141-1652(-)